MSSGQDSRQYESEDPKIIRLEEENSQLRMRIAELEAENKSLKERIAEFNNRTQILEYDDGGDEWPQ